MTDAVTRDEAREFVNELRDFAVRNNIDLSKADMEETKRLLSEPIRYICTKCMIEYHYQPDYRCCDVCGSYCDVGSLQGIAGALKKELIRCTECDNIIAIGIGNVEDEEVWNLRCEYHSS